MSCAPTATTPTTIATGRRPAPRPTGGSATSGACGHGSPASAPPGRATTPTDTSDPSTVTPPTRCSSSAPDSTPPRRTRTRSRVNDLLPNSVLLTVDGWGHTSADIPSDCTVQTVSRLPARRHDATPRHRLRRRRRTIRCPCILQPHTGGAQPEPLIWAAPCPFEAVQSVRVARAVRRVHVDAFASASCRRRWTSTRMPTAHRCRYRMSPSPRSAPHMSASPWRLVSGAPRGPPGAFGATARPRHRALRSRPQAWPLTGRLAVTVGRSGSVAVSWVAVDAPSLHQMHSALLGTVPDPASMRGGGPSIAGVI